MEMHHQARYQVASGINVTCFKAHSCTAASRSKTKQIGISVKEIFKRSSWKKNISKILQ